MKIPFVASLLLVAGAGCAVLPDQVRAVPLRDTHWTLSRLGNDPVIISNRQREPHLVFLGTERVAGLGGCNRLMGAYKLGEDTVSFDRIASTRMACADGSETEAKFLAALERVRYWKIAGQQLELFDAGRASLMRFEAGEAK